MIWNKTLDLQKINLFNKNTLVELLDIQITKFGDDFLEGTMPVNEKTFQPMKLLHGGASCVLAESLGSIAANLVIDQNEFAAFGQHIEATHLRPVKNGLVRGVAKALAIGKTSQTWNIQIFNEENKLVCDSKLIIAVREKSK